MVKFVLFVIQNSIFNIRYSFFLLFVLIPFGSAFDFCLYKGIGRRGKPVNPAMRRFAVTFETLPLFQVIVIPGKYTAKVSGANDPFVTADAVGLHGNFSRFPDENHLRLGAHGKNCGMP